VRAPAIYAKSAYVLDVNSGSALFQKFPDARRFPASTVKMMTGLLVAESGRLDEVATVSRLAASIGETTMGLRAGEQVPVLELLYGLMLNSGNDAAMVLAEHFAGSSAAFAEGMNARAAALGLANTQFANPHGLDHGGFASSSHYSSARDLAVLGAAAMANPVLAQVAGTTRREVAELNGPPGQPPHRLRNTVGALWWYPGAIGVKTGWTGRAGQVRVVAAERAGTRLVAVVMDSPDDVREVRDLLDYGFAAGGRAEAQATVPLNADAWPAPDAQLSQAWEAYKRLALAPEGRVRRGARGDEASADAQAAALLQAVWLRDRAAFDSLWTWTNAALSRRRAPAGAGKRNALFASRWARGAVVDWSNSTAADQRVAAALLLASRLWNEPRYERDARAILDAVLNDAAFSWPNLGLAAANSVLKDLEPVTTSAATLTPAFYRMFAEGGRNATWLRLLDGTYATLERATAPDASWDGLPAPLAGPGLPPSWFSVSHRDGQVGQPIDPTWQSTGFGEAGAALVAQLALDLQWSGDPRAHAALAATARALARDLAQQGRIAAAYTRGGAAASAAETAAYGPLAGLALLEPGAAAALRAKLEAALASRDPDRMLGAIEGLWLLGGGPPSYWRIWWPPEDVPTTRNDAVVPPGDAYPWRYFEETGHTVHGPFLDFFGRTGGVEVYGLPRTDELVEDGRWVQYFQRGRLEVVAEREGGADVALAPLGARAAQARGALTRPEARPIAPFESDDVRLYVPETGHSVSAGFRSFYERHGGAAVLGIPLTEELTEDGFTVQYFERLVLEYLPGRPVQASLLGDDLLREKGWLK
jgi:D-alanyl-D-alanine carboxypeptidase